MKLDILVSCYQTHGQVVQSLHQFDYGVVVLKKTRCKEDYVLFISYPTKEFLTFYTTIFIIMNFLNPCRTVAIQSDAWFVFTEACRFLMLSVVKL